MSQVPPGLVVVALDMPPQQGLLATAAVEAGHQRGAVQLNLDGGQGLLGAAGPWINNEMAIYTRWCPPNDKWVINA